MLTYANFQFKPKKGPKAQEASFGPKISSAFSIVANQFSKPPNLAPIFSTSHHFKPFGPHTPTKMEVEHPPPG